MSGGTQIWIVASYEIEWTLFVLVETHRSPVAKGHMIQSSTSELQARLDGMTEAFRKCEERSTAGRLALEMIHEIKNPLEALGHLTYLALEQADDPCLIRHYMRLAEEQMSLLRHIAHQTLGYAKSSDEAKPIDLVALAEAALRIHQRTIYTKKIHLVKDVPEKLIVQLYMGEMLQVISNLVVNAVDALKTYGTLHLRLKTYKGRVHLLIADNGHGIPAEHIDVIFEPFFTTKGEQGTGLGLALTKKIIDHHDGQIRVRSSVRTDRSGTAFRISLPS